MPPNPAAASPDGEAEASQGRAVIASPSVGGSLRRRRERLAWADLHEITRGGFQNNRVIDTGKGGRKRRFKALVACRLKFLKQMVLIDWSGHENSKRRFEE